MSIAVPIALLEHLSVGSELHAANAACIAASGVTHVLNANPLQCRRHAASAEPSACQYYAAQQLVLVDHAQHSWVTALEALIEPFGFIDSSVGDTARADSTPHAHAHAHAHAHDEQDEHAHARPACCMVYCRAGTRQSMLIVLPYLMLVHEMSLEEAHRFVLARGAGPVTLRDADWEPLEMLDELVAGVRRTSRVRAAPGEAAELLRALLHIARALERDEDAHAHDHDHERADAHDHAHAHAHAHDHGNAHAHAHALPVLAEAHAASSAANAAAASSSTAAPAAAAAAAAAPADRSMRDVELLVGVEGAEACVARLAACVHASGVVDPLLARVARVPASCGRGLVGYALRAAVLRDATASLDACVSSVAPNDLNALYSGVLRMCGSWLDAPALVPGAGWREWQERIVKLALGEVMSSEQASPAGPTYQQLCVGVLTHVPIVLACTTARALDVGRMRSDVSQLARVAACASRELLDVVGVCVERALVTLVVTAGGAASAPRIEYATLASLVDAMTAHASLGAVARVCERVRADAARSGALSARLTGAAGGVQQVQLVSSGAVDSQDAAFRMPPAMQQWWSAVQSEFSAMWPNAVLRPAGHLGRVVATVRTKRGTLAKVIVSPHAAAVLTVMGEAEAGTVRTLAQLCADAGLSLESARRAVGALTLGDYVDVDVTRGLTDGGDEDDAGAADEDDGDNAAENQAAAGAAASADGTAVSPVRPAPFVCRGKLLVLHRDGAPIAGTLALDRARAAAAPLAVADGDAVSWNDDFELMWHASVAKSAALRARHRTVRIGV